MVTMILSFCLVVCLGVIIAVDLIPLCVFWDKFVLSLSVISHSPLVFCLASIYFLSGKLTQNVGVLFHPCCWLGRVSPEGKGNEKWQTAEDGEKGRGIETQENEIVVKSRACLWYVQCIACSLFLSKSRYLLTCASSSGEWERVVVCI